MSALRRQEFLAQALVDSPLPLALLRIVVPLVIVCSPELFDGPRLAASPELSRFVPEGLGLVTQLSLSAGAVRVLQIVALSSAATAMLGYASRVSMLVLTLSGGLVFSFSQRQGAVVHDMHLFWLCALCAASPCGDAWSLDAWGKPLPPPGVRYGVPLTGARVLLGLVYFFPGYYKLRDSGLAWASSANVTAHMHAKWLEHGRVPFVRIDHAPLLCAVGAALVIAFELSFVILALAKRTRVFALAAGLAFHFSTQVFFFITFTSLWACYVVLLEPRWLEAVDRRLRGLAAATTDVIPARATRASVVVAAALVACVAVQGIRGVTQAWPFACYPRFSHLQEDAIPEIVVELTTTHGEHVRLTGRERAPRSQAEWGRVFRLSGAYGTAPDPVALRAYAAQVAGDAAIEPTQPVSVYRVLVPTAPERWSETPSGGVLLTALSPPLRAPRGSARR